MQFYKKVVLSLVLLAGTLAAPVPRPASADVADLADLTARAPAPVWMNIEKHSIDESYENAHRQHIMGHDEWLHPRENEDETLVARDLEEIVDLEAREPLHWMNIERHELREENLSKRRQHIMNIAGHDEWLREVDEAAEIHRRENDLEVREPRHHLWRVGVEVHPKFHFDLKPDHTHFA